LCQNEQQNVNVNPDNLTVIIHGSKRQILTRLVKMKIRSLNKIYICFIFKDVLKVGLKW